MKKILVFVLLLSSIVFLSFGSAWAQKPDTNAIVKQLNDELEKEAVFAPRELRGIRESLKNMLDKGATKDDLKKVLTDLSKKGVRDEDLKKAINGMNDLVNDGEAPRRAGNIVSRAAHLALAQGLKGKDLAARVHEAIRQRKVEREQLKVKVKTQERGQAQQKGPGPGMGAGKGKGK